MTALPMQPLAAQPVVASRPNENQQDALGVVSRQSLADAVVRAHKAGLDARRQRDLLSEKFLLHIDGSGDFQWADIFEGSRIDIPRGVSEFRRTENLLRPVVDNAVAHHTTMPLRYLTQ